MNNQSEEKLKEIYELLEWNTLEREAVGKLLNALKYVNSDSNEEVLGRIQGMQSNLLFAQKIMLKILEQAEALKKCLSEQNN